MPLAGSVKDAADAMIDLVAESRAEGAFEDVMCYLGWWDCPRSGVALIGGKPHFFDCRFSEELDDYPDLYQVWPCPARGTGRRARSLARVGSVARSA